MKPFVMTDQQKRFFHTFGYLSFPGLFQDEIGKITEEFEWVLAKYGGHHDGRKRTMVYPFPDKSEYLTSLTDDYRIREINRCLLGEEYNYITGDGNFYVGNTRWHSDYDWNTPVWPDNLCRYKMAFYLDPVTKDTGCLRVIPGSHLMGDVFADRLEEYLVQSKHPTRCEESLGIHGADVPAIALETEPGDLVLFNQQIKHAAFGGNERRRMFTLNFTRIYPENRKDELMKIINQAAHHGNEHFYGEIVVRTAGPERMKHLRQILENESHLPELLAKTQGGL